MKRKYLCMHMFTDAALKEIIKSMRCEFMFMLQSLAQQMATPTCLRNIALRIPSESHFAISASAAKRCESEFRSWALSARIECANKRHQRDSYRAQSTLSFVDFVWWWRLEDYYLFQSFCIWIRDMWLLCVHTVITTVPSANKSVGCGDKTIKIHEKTAIKKC